ncbi:MAG: hypothetical protein HWD61_07550 [Parachlamydiaceae bacterium]|nr:MAG: hypothetical protein HWD61_07550 [Parachlamydiaceae bacterium]
MKEFPSSKASDITSQPQEPAAAQETAIDKTQPREIAKEQKKELHLILLS